MNTEPKNEGGAGRKIFCRKSEAKPEPERLAADGLRKPTHDLEDAYAGWCTVIQLLMFFVVVCVLLGQGLSAIALAIVIHASAKIQQAEADRDAANVK